MELQLPVYLIYPIYTAVIALALILVVPRPEIKRLLIYGIIFGAIINAVLMAVHSSLDLGGHINYGSFGLGNFSFFPPIAWTLWFIMFFYFLPELPEHSILTAVYIVSAAAYAMFFSNVLVNLEVFVWKAGRVIYPFFLYLIWFTIAAWGYFRIKDKFQQ